MKQVGLVRTGSGMFSIDVEGADIRTVCRAISEFSGRNIVVAQEAKGTVRVSLKNVALQDALRTVLRMNGLDYAEEGAILRVDFATKLQQEAVDREQARASADLHCPPPLLLDFVCRSAYSRMDRDSIRPYLDTVLVRTQKVSEQVIYGDC